ncbi:MAG: M1 family metallopeptidase [Bacteroidia bacterium]
MKKFLFVALLFAQAVSAQNTYRSYLKDNTAYREHSLDITKMKVEVSFEPEKGLVKGKVTHTFTVLQKNVDSVFFDAPEIKIKSASLNNQPVNFSTNKQGIWVKPGRSFQPDETGTILFEYEATPKKGIYFIGWNVPENKVQSPWAVRKQVWTQGQGVDNRYWIPMYDDMNDKYVTETVITFDKDYEVLSNGSLLKKTANKDNTITWNYCMTHPHSGYLLMLGIGKYAIKQTKSGRGVPMHLYYYPEFPERAEPTYRYSEKMIDVFERETGVNFPWESYSQIMVQDFIYGAMENTTATVYGDFFNTDLRSFKDRNYIGVNLHELAHQWTGDLVTARDGRDTWLQESFATFFPKSFVREIYGEDDYNWSRRGEQNGSVEATKKDRNAIRFAGAGTSRVYGKGSGVISMMNYVLGEDQWRRAFKYYLEKHAYANVETNDLNQAIQDKLGKDLSWFFDEWVYRGGEPHYTVHYDDLTYNDATRSTEISVQQTHPRDEQVGLFKMPIVFEVHYKNGSKDSIMSWIQDETTILKIPNKNKKEIAFVLFDPNSMVMKSVVFKKSFEELKEQVLNARFMLDRYDALVALKEFETEKKRDLLLDVFNKETFREMRSEVINQLILDNDQKTIAAFKTVFNQYFSSPKLAVIKGLNGNENNYKDVLEKALADSSYDVVQNTLEKLCKVFPADAKKYLEATKGTDGMNNSVKIKWLEISVMNEIDKQKNLDELVSFTFNTWEFRTRTNAFASLKALNYCDEKVAANLFDALLNWNGRLAGSASEVVQYFSQQLSHKNLFIRYYQSKSWTELQKETLKKQMNFLP